MVYEEVPHVLHMVVIAGRELQDKLIAMISENGGHVINIYYGRGTHKSGSIMDIFGLVREQDKVVISCLISESEAAAIFDILIMDFRFNKPNTGIAYVIPVEQLSY